MNITTLEIKRCTGCQMCYNICPANAITMQEDAEGFLRPVVGDNCIDCGLCAAKCPALTGVRTVEDGAMTFAVQCADAVRGQCSSGGVFKALADNVLRRGGVVCGAAFDEDYHRLHHVIVESKRDLPTVLCSKYVQSDIGRVFRDVKSVLQSGKPVLFCGCPCQVDGLKTYLGKSYPNLLTADLLCHGAPSPLAYRTFLVEANPDKKKVNSVTFRNAKGWGLQIAVNFADGTQYTNPPDGTYMRAFLSGINMREACYQCPYASTQRIGDLTLGDYWGVKAQWNDGKGTSLVVAHTLKGAAALDEIRADCRLFEQVPYEDALDACRRTNGAMVKPTPKHPMRDVFFNHLKTDGFYDALRYADKSLMDVGILGWWIHTANSNYGSTLTAFALERYCASLGLSTAFISPPGFDRATAGSFNTRYHYRMTAKYTPEEMWRNNQFFKTYIVGSDVLWYYDAMIASAGYNFMLNFASDDIRKISYSTSFGNPKYFFPDNAIPYATSLLKRFDSLSTREIEGVRILKEKFGVEATQVVDPVFLCPRSTWDELAGNAARRTEEPFVFAYFLDPNPDKICSFDQLARHFGYRQVCATDRQYKPEEKAKMLANSGFMPEMSIEEFIYHLMHARFVMTDSFHGTCFSLVFRRDFYAFPNTQRDTTRFDTLSQIFGIADRMILTPGQRRTDAYPSVDYRQVEPRILEHTERSKQWLQHALFDPRRPKPED